MERFQLRSTYFFGQDAINGLSEVFSQNSYKKIMLVYGFSSIKKSGLYDQIVQFLNKFNLPFCEYSGIKANPRDWQCDEAADLAIAENVDLIIAAGGGSTIDAAKVISVCAKNRKVFPKAWGYVEGGHNSLKKIIHAPIDILSILTTAATGSENNVGSVITNEELKMKIGVWGPREVTPKYVIEDPKYTFSLNHYQTACGIFDIFTHLLEQYYGKELFAWTEEYLVANMKIVLKYAKVVLDNPNNYDARANIMWTSSWALNGLASFNGAGQSWDIHSLEHSLSAVFDVAHGAGLALIAPVYIQQQCKKDALFHQKTIALGKKIFGVDTCEAFISALSDFIKELKLPAKYSDFDNIKTINESDIELLTKNCNAHLNANSLLANFDEIKAVYNQIKK